MKYDVLVIGAGAAGCMAAGTAAENGKKVLLLERNDRIGRKVMITGKGRCNVTNACSLLNELIENVPVNGRFLYGAFSRFMPFDTMDFFEGLGVPLKSNAATAFFPNPIKRSILLTLYSGILHKTEYGVKKPGLFVFIPMGIIFSSPKMKPEKSMKPSVIFWLPAANPIL